MMSRKGIAKLGKEAAKRDGKPAIEPTGVGTGYLDKGVREIKDAKKKRQAEIDKIMKDL